jgi:uncharacterized protein (TIGR02118 family)
MAAQVVVLYNTPADADAFGRHYTEIHTPLVKKMPGLRSLNVSQGPVATPQGPAPYHFVATLTFDSMAELQAAFGSSEGRATAADLRNFAQAGVTILMFESHDV